MDDETKTIRDQIIEKYGDVVVTFHHYHKFTFYFRGTAPDGAEIELSEGGGSGEIYKNEITNNETATVRDLTWRFYRATVTLNGEETYTYYDY